MTQVREKICADPNKDAALHCLAAIAWAEATDQERAVVRFGMVPVTLLHHFDMPPTVTPFTSREIALALYEQANTHGGMVV